MGLVIISREVGPTPSEVAKAKSGRNPVNDTKNKNKTDLKKNIILPFFIALETSNIYLLECENN